jgi:hypothetical protein
MTTKKPERCEEDWDAAQAALKAAQTYRVALNGSTHSRGPDGFDMMLISEDASVTRWNVKRRPPDNRIQSSETVDGHFRRSGSADLNSRSPDAARITTG